MEMKKDEVRAVLCEAGDTHSPKFNTARLQRE